MVATVKPISYWVKMLWRVFWFGLGFVVLIFLLANFGVFGKMPSLQELENPEADLASEIYSADGKLMGKYYAENRSEVKYSEISPNVINALVATEDERFYDHSGIDARAVGRAIVSFGSDGGASTITQQLAKMILKRQPGGFFKTLTSKVKEWIVAVKLERNFTKEEIIALYLNRAAWGNIYGIRNVSRTYFQKEPIDLKLEEAAVLVGWLKGGKYDPVRFPKNAVERRNTVLNQMVVAKQQFLTESEATKMKAKPLVTNYKQIDEAIGIAPHFRRSLLELLKPWIEKSRNPKTGEPYDLYRDGLKIYTTIDSRMQAYAEQATTQHLPQLQRKLNAALRGRRDKVFLKHQGTLETAMKYSERWKIMKEAEIPEEEIRKSFNVPVKMKIFTWANEKHEMDTVMTPMDSIKYHKLLMQTSFMAMDPISGEVKAWVGSIDFKWFKYDHVLANRQVGSTFKPLLYTLAITDAGYTPETHVEGGSLTLSGKTIKGGGGTLAYCLARSLNAAAWRLMSVIGVKRTIEFAHQCGIKVKIPPYPSIALGSAEIPLLEITQSYTMFPNKGYNTEPVYATRIEDKNGNLLYEFPIAQSKQVIGEADAYTMVKMMEGVIKTGTAKSLNSYNIPVQKAGKTGTTNDNTDGWFIGYTPQLVAGSWVGCDDPFIPIYQNNIGGAEMSAPRWGIFMSKVYGDRKLPYSKKEFDEPAILKNDPILADANLMNLSNMGTEEVISGDKGNGEASDFFTDGNDTSNADGGMIGPDTSLELQPQPTAPKGQNPATPPVDSKKPGNEAVTTKPETKLTDKKVDKKTPTKKPTESNDYK